MVCLKNSITGENMSSSAYLESEYDITKKCGYSLVEKCPVFSSDGEFLFVISKNVIRVHSVKTSDLVRNLESDDTANIVTIAFLNIDGQSLIACYENGKLYEWDWNNGICLSNRVVQLQDNLNKVISFDILDDKHAFISLCNSYSLDVSLAIVNYHTATISRKLSAKNIKYSKVWSVAIGHRNDGDKFAAICNGSSFLYTLNLGKHVIARKHKNYNNVPLLAVTAHPINSCVAVGDAIGRAIIMYGDFDIVKKLEFEVLHWHQLPLTALAFSQQGSYLLTGGMEQVIVKWSPGAQYTKSVMPRLPGQIKYIATDNIHVAISTSNNSIQITNAQLFLEGTILESGGLAELTGLQGPGLLYHPISSSLIIGGHTGHLSLFSTVSNRLLYNMDITMMNRIPLERENLHPDNMEIVCAAVSANGRWLVTSEYRNDGINASEERLKFWLADGNIANTSTPFVLNTFVNLAHRGARVNEIVLSKHGDVCLTAGSDNKFRLWTTDESVISGVRRTRWKCIAVCFYSQDCDYIDRLKYDNLKSTDNKNTVVMNGDLDMEFEGTETVHSDSDSKVELGKVALSEDGSLVAAWWGAKLGLWNTGSCEVCASLSHPALRPVGRDVKFGCGDSAHYIVCTTDECLAAWHILSLSLIWVVKMHPVCLTADPLSNKMAVVTKENNVYIFKPQDPQYLLRKQRVLDPSLGVLSACVFAEASKDNLRLYLLRNNQEIFCLEPKNKSPEDKMEQVLTGGAPMSNFSSLLAQKRINDVKASVKGDQSSGLLGVFGNKAIDELLASSAHTLPSMSLLKTPFLHALVGAKDTKSEATSDVDSSSDVEDDIESEVEDIKPKFDDMVRENRSITGVVEKVANITIDQKLEAIEREKIDWADTLII